MPMGPEIRQVAEPYMLDGTRVESGKLGMIISASGMMRGPRLL